MHKTHIFIQQIIWLAWVSVPLRKEIFFYNLTIDMTKEFVCNIHVHQHVLYTQSILVISTWREQAWNCIYEKSLYVVYQQKKKKKA